MRLSASYENFHKQERPGAVPTDRYELEANNPQTAFCLNANMQQSRPCQNKTHPQTLSKNLAPLPAEEFS